MSAILDITPTLGAVSPPIRIDEQGVARIGNTRVTLNTFVSAFDAGSTAEEIVHHFPSISLVDAYGAATYYLANRAAVKDYIAAREAEAAPLINRLRTEFEASDLRRRLIARRDST